MVPTAMKLFLLALVATCALGRATQEEEKVSRKRPITRLDHMVSSIQELSRIPQVKQIIDEHEAFFRRVYEADHKEWMPDMPGQHAGEPQSILECGPMPPSSEKPTSVHRLRPADIDVVGAVGDSLTAGNGARAWTLVGCLREYRGNAAPIGGQNEYDDVTTTPNLFRVINEDVYGYSVGVSPYDNVEEAKFNLAEPGNEAKDMVRQVNNLVERIRADPNVDFENDWKMVTLFIGGNDMCTYCTDYEFYSPENYAANIEAALDILHAELPRTLVNVLILFDFSQIVDLSNNIGCGMVHMFVCPCKPKTPEEVDEVQQLSFQYQDALQALVDSGKYDTKEDFTVVAQPFLRFTTPPLKEDGSYDYSYWAPDCFHFSDKSHNVAGIALWNNLIEPVGGKTEHWMLDGDIKCTTGEQPYVATRLNSEGGEWLPRDD